MREYNADRQAAAWSNAECFCFASLCSACMLYNVMLIMFPIMSETDILHYHHQPTSGRHCVCVKDARAMMMISLFIYSILRLPAAFVVFNSIYVVHSSVKILHAYSISVKIFLYLLYSRPGSVLMVVIAYFVVTLWMNGQICVEVGGRHSSAKVCVCIRFSMVIIICAPRPVYRKGC